MFGFLIIVALMVAAGYAFSKVGNYVECVVTNGMLNEKTSKTAEKAINTAATKVAQVTASGYNRLPRLIASFAATAAAFVVLAVGVSLVAPPQANFEVGNVDWATRDTGYVGNAVDAILVRTTGATIEQGLLYSTAVLRGQTYVSVFGSPWIATNDPAGLAFVCYCALAIIGGVVGLVIDRAMTAAAISRLQVGLATPAPAAG